MFKLDPEVEKQIAEARKMMLNQRQTMASLSDKNLVVAAKFWMAHCVAPKQFQPEEPIYDATMWHAILPEMIRRLEEK